MYPAMTTRQIETATADIFSTATICRHTSAELYQRLREQITEPMQTRTPAGRRRFTSFARGYAAGVIAEKLNALWYKEVEFCYRDEAGQIFSTHKQSAHRSTEEFYAAGRGVELARMECAHVWKGTDKPFTPWTSSTPEQHT